MYESFFQENDKKVNRILSKILVWITLAIPLMALFTFLGVFFIDVQYFVYLVIIGICVAGVPYCLYKLNVSQSVIKYYLVITISTALCILGTNQNIGIFITLVLGAIFSLPYFDPRLTAFASVLDLLLMFVCQYFRMVDRYGASYSSPEVIDHWIAYSVGYLIEFCIVCPFLIWMAYSSRKIIYNNYLLLEELKIEKRRYTVALENSQDVIFEYNVDADSLKYTGPLFSEDFANNKEKTDETIIENFLDSFLPGVIFSEDESSIRNFLDGDCSNPVEIRIKNKNNVYWYRFEGSATKVDGFAVNIIGKIHDITDSKNEERQFLEEADKDEITGFYDKLVGLRIIEQHSADFAESSKVCIYVNLSNYRTIEMKMGSVFLDAIIARMADIMRFELRDGDMAIRLSRSGFILYLGNRTAHMLDALLIKLQQEFAKIYIGKEIGEILQVECNIYQSLIQLQSVVYSDLMNFETVEGNDQVVNFASNVLDHSNDIETAVFLVLDRLGGLYNLDEIIVLEGRIEHDLIKCLYEWNSTSRGMRGRMAGDMVHATGFMNNQHNYICSYKTRDNYSGCVVFSGGRLLSPERGQIIKRLENISKLLIEYIHRRSIKAITDNSNIISAMSYEVRTPMNSISGFTNLLLREDSSPIVRKYAGNIKSSSDHLLKVLNNIIDLSAIESGRMDIDETKYYLHEYVDDIRGYADDVCNEREIWFIFRKKSSMPDGLIGDGTRISQVVQSYVDDILHSLIDGQLGMDIDWEAGTDNAGLLCISLWVRGTTEENQADEKPEKNEKEDTSNNSVAITVSNELIKLMGGTVSVEDEDTTDHKILIRIPQRVFDTRDHAYGSVRIQKKYSENEIPFTASRARALIVDDNRINLEVAKGLISNYKLSIVTASSGKEALDILRDDQDFDIVFMDYLMPEMDGIETTQRIRGIGNPRLQKIPIVALTANIVKGMEDKYYLAGMNEVLSKPIDLTSLAETMIRYIPRDKYDYRA